MKIIVIGTLPSSLINFRGELLKELREHCSSVIAMASGATSSEVIEIEKYATEYIDYDVSRSGLNPFKDLKTLFELYQYLNKEKPELILAYTIKPIIWGGIASRMANLQGFYALVTGLGFAFQSGGRLKNILNLLVRFLYRRALKSAKGVIFQNPDNRKKFIEQEIVNEATCYLVNGSGVDLSYFQETSLPSKNHFLLIARLLKDKGLREYVLAANIVKKSYPSVVFDLVGPEDPSPNGISIDEIKNCENNGVICYHGTASDVRPYIRQCSIFVLPSYHEGMPRTVLESMAMGRPILTTDVPGCRETVINGKNGWLVEKGNAEQLAERMIWFIENQDQWLSMGRASRQMAIERFDVKKVNTRLLELMGL